MVKSFKREGRGGKESERERERRRIVRCLEFALAYPSITCCGKYRFKNEEREGREVYVEREREREREREDEWCDA